MLPRRGYLGAATALCLLALPPFAAAAPSRAGREAARTILVRFAPSVSSARRSAFLSRAGARPVRTLGRIGYVEARVAPARRAAALVTLRRSGATETLQRAHVLRALDTVPVDPGYAPDPWPWQALRLPRAWDVTTGSASVRIAIVDTGVASGQADLAGRILPGVDLVGGDESPDDDNGHGTEVATTAAGSMNGGQSVGACPACSIVPVKVLDASGSGTDANVAAGILWAIAHGAQIVNLSLGGGSSDPVLAAAVAAAVSQGVLVVAAAGNGASSEPSYPAAYDGVVGVGASDRDGRLFGFSQFGPLVDVAAPGCVTAGDMTNGIAVGLCGTSFSAPLVAGTAGLALAQNPSLTAAQVKALLETTATATGADVRAGVVDAAGVLGVSTAPAAAPQQARPAKISAGVDARRARRRRPLRQAAKPPRRA
jgi:subtilisin family serine protease